MYSIFVHMETSTTVPGWAADCNYKPFNNKRRFSIHASFQFLLTYDYYYGYV